MIKMSLATAVLLFLVLVIYGRAAPDEDIAAAPPPGRVSRLVDLVDRTKLAGEPLPAPAVVRPAEGMAATPVRREPMPGPSLKPSPEYRTRPAGDDRLAGKLFKVGTNGARVRAGQGTGFGVVGRVSRGEEVLVVADPGAGWVEIRIEGDGISGWMAKNLLHPVN